MLSKPMSIWFEHELEGDSRATLRDLNESTAEHSEEDIAEECGVASFDTLYAELHELISRHGWDAGLVFVKKKEGTPE